MFSSSSTAPEDPRAPDDSCGSSCGDPPAEQWILDHQDFTGDWGGIMRAHGDEFGAGSVEPGV